MPLPKSAALSFAPMDVVLGEFEGHATRMRERARARLEAVQLRNVVEDRKDREAISAAESLGKRLPSDEFEGDVNMRTLRYLLKKIDDNGFERVRRPRPVIHSRLSHLPRVAHRATINSNSTLHLNAPRRASSTATSGRQKNL